MKPITGMTGATVSLVLWLLATLPVAAADADPLFRSTGPLDITLSGPFTTIDRERDREEAYKGGTLTYMDDGLEVTLDVDFKVRGNFRLRSDICNYAQLWLDLDRGQVAGTLFENQNRIKLVVQCKTGARFERYVVKEHQVYQLFNTLSDISFRSRLVNVTYRDTGRDRTRTHVGVLIENKDRLADRVGLDNVDLNNISYTALDPVQSNLVDMFMYMVANTDYSIISAPEDECCHNAKLFQPEGRNTYFPAPYDFDSSGYVNAAYAEPNAALKLRSVRQRLYRGFCVPESVMNNTLAAYRENHDRIMAIAGDTRFVNQQVAKSSVEYLENFFEIINDPEKLQDEILDDCRG